MRQNQFIGSVSLASVTRTLQWKIQLGFILVLVKNFCVFRCAYPVWNNEVMRLSAALFLFDEIRGGEPAVHGRKQTASWQVLIVIYKDVLFVLEVDCIDGAHLELLPICCVVSLLVQCSVQRLQRKLYWIRRVTRLIVNLVVKLVVKV